MNENIGSEASFRKLGLSPEASWDEVKSAFRRLARRYHPDVAGPAGAMKFAEITAAYMCLKDVIAPGAAPGPRRAAAQAWSDDAMATPKPKSLWRRLLDKFFGGFARTDGTAPDEEAFEFSPARERFIESVIARTEAYMNTLLSRRDEVKKRNRVDGFTKRLRSKHPSVVLLALQQLSIRGMNDDLRRILVDHFNKNIPTSEVLLPLLTLFSASAGDAAAALARSLARHSSDMSATDALNVLRWMKRCRVPKEIATPFLRHSSASVIAGALSQWELVRGMPDVTDVTQLIKRDEEEILVPLLRILRQEGAPQWAMPVIDDLAKSHLSSAVRVWASSIVREQKIG